MEIQTNETHRPERFLTIQSMRFICFLFVFLCHFPYHRYSIDDPLPKCGAFGVSFFFILSGFLLNAGYGERFATKSLSYTDFISKRVLKTIPTNTIFLFITVLLLYPAFYLKPFLIHLTLTQSWFFLLNVDNTYNMPAWFISTLLFSYILFPAAANIVNKLPIKRLLAIIIAMATPLIILVITVPPLNIYWEYYLFYSFPPFRFIDFFIGMSYTGSINQYKPDISPSNTNL